MHVWKCMFEKKKTIPKIWKKVKFHTDTDEWKKNVWKREHKKSFFELYDSSKAIFI